jgi:hypothetical protein
LRTSCKIAKNLLFSLREFGVGGIAEVEPIASSGFGGDVERRVRSLLFKDLSSGNTY